MANRLALADGTSLLLLANGVDHLLLASQPVLVDMNATSSVTISGASSSPTDSPVRLPE